MYDGKMSLILCGTMNYKILAMKRHHTAQFHKTLIYYPVRNELFLIENVMIFL
jgi:hypothetical protein